LGLIERLRILGDQISFLQNQLIKIRGTVAPQFLTHILINFQKIIIIIIIIIKIIIIIIIRVYMWR